MNDVARRERLDKPQLEYPFANPPGIGQSLEVAPGVHWIRLPLPFALDHINVWALQDRDGWTLVDTGIRSEETLGAWRALFASAEHPMPIRRIICTHMHPDHVGMAGWLARKFGCRLWMTQLEYLNCRVLAGDTGRAAPQEALHFYRTAGWSAPAIESYEARFGNFGKHIHALPDSYRRIGDGDVLSIGAYSWRVVTGSGHSPEHACLYCEELQLLISGDQVLPKISSNVSVYPTEPDADPMHAWLESLEKIKAQVPSGVLVLPAHNDCFRGLHARIDYLIQGQHRTLDRLRKTLAQPCRAVDVFVALFGKSIDEADGGLLGLATGESMACLNYLMQRGELSVHADEDGVHWYRMA